MTIRATIAAVCAMLAVAGIGIAATPAAADTATVIKQRAALMKQQGGDAKAIHDFLEGQAPKAKAVAAAADLTQTTRKIPSVFPAGSGGVSPDGKFSTKPAIWSDWKEFLAVQSSANEKADALAAALKTDDKKRIGAAFADLGKNGCGGCHTKFREQLQK